MPGAVFTLITAPAAEPITAAALKLRLGIDASDAADDAWIAVVINAARQKIEAFTGRALITQTWELRLPDWPAMRRVDLLKPPLQSITSVKYTTGAVELTLAATNYEIDAASEPGALVFDADAALPAVDDLPAAVKIRYVCGYGATGASVPGGLIVAVTKAAELLYSGCEIAMAGHTCAAAAAAWPYRVLRI